MSRTRQTFPYAEPTTRPTFVAPMLRLPCWRMSIPRLQPMSRPKGTAPSRYAPITKQVVIMESGIPAVGSGESGIAAQAQPLRSKAITGPFRHPQRPPARLRMKSPAIKVSSRNPPGTSCANPRGQIPKQCQPQHAKAANLVHRCTAMRTERKTSSEVRLNPAWLQIWRRSRVVFSSSWKEETRLMPPSTQSPPA